MTTREIPVNGRQKIDITLDNNAVNLDDVVVIGYGTQSRATVTSAITKVKAEDMAVMPSNNVMSMLQGKSTRHAGQFLIGTSRCQSGGHHTWRHYNHSRFRRSTIHNRRCDTHNHRPQLCRYRIGRGAERRSLDSYIWCESGQRYRDDYHKTGQKGAGRISVSYGLSIDHQPKRIPISDAREYLSITREAATRAYNPDKYLNGSFGMSTNNVIDSYVNCAFLDDWITRYGQGYVENLLTNRGWETMEDPATPGKMLLFKTRTFRTISCATPSTTTSTSTSREATTAAHII